jgi:serine/threonine protein kinase
MSAEDVSVSASAPPPPESSSERAQRELLIAQQALDAYATDLYRERYKLCKQIGKGAYGVVCAAKNKETGGKVAIKKITPMCASPTDGKHTLRELRLVRWLGKHPNVISLRDIILDVAGV